MRGWKHSPLCLYYKLTVDERYFSTIMDISTNYCCMLPVFGSIARIEIYYKKGKPAKARTSRNLCAMQRISELKTPCANIWRCFFICYKSFNINVYSLTDSQMGSVWSIFLARATSIPRYCPIFRCYDWNRFYCAAMYNCH